MGGGAADRLSTDYTRTGNGLHTDGQQTGGALRTTRPTNASAPIIHINTAKAKIEAAGGTVA